jgi:hypothetical protein
MKKHNPCHHLLYHSLLNEYNKKSHTHTHFSRDSIGDMNIKEEDDVLSSIPYKSLSIDK